MFNGNWVCFDCRTVLRRPSWRLATYFQPWLVGGTGNGGILCPDCKKPCRFLGHKIAVPPKRDDNGWKQLLTYVNERRRSFLDGKAQTDTRRKHEIERRILELQSRPGNKERDRLIKELREKLNSLR